MCVCGCARAYVPADVRMYVCGNPLENIFADVVIPQVSLSLNYLNDWLLKVCKAIDGLQHTFMPSDSSINNSRSVVPARGS